MPEGADSAAAVYYHRQALTTQTANVLPDTWRDAAESQLIAHKQQIESGGSRFSAAASSLLPPAAGARGFPGIYARVFIHHVGIAGPKRPDIGIGDRVWMFDQAFGN